MRAIPRFVRFRTRADHDRPKLECDRGDQPSPHWSRRVAGRVTLPTRREQQPSRQSCLRSSGTTPRIPQTGRDYLRSIGIGHSSRRTCSTSRPRWARPPVIAGRSMRLSAIDGRPERRSDDGQMILRVASAGQNLGLDLPFCGAPLRNRTVDLLLTIWTFPGSLPSTVSAGPAAAARPVYRDLRPAGKHVGCETGPREFRPSERRDHRHPACHSGSTREAQPRPATFRPTVR